MTAARGPQRPDQRPLAEIDHPFYGAEGTSIDWGTLDQLIDAVQDCDAGMNHVYRWDWNDWADVNDDGKPSDPATLTLFLVMPRKSLLVSWSAPVTAADDARVRAFLASERVLGALRELWEPFL